MLISIGKIYFVYIVKTNKINKRLRVHNSGIRFNTPQPVHLCPHSVFAYIYGLNRNKSSIHYIEHKWKYNVRRLRSQGINNTRICLQRGGYECLNIDL